MAAFEEAMKRGYKKILWCDCSVWAVNDPGPIFDLIDRDGYFFLRSGIQSVQTCSDKCLAYFGLTRDEVVDFEDIQTGIIGFDLTQPDSLAFLERWIQSAKDGAFAGSREHDNQSQDPRFLYHRQDQSCASLIGNLWGKKYKQWAFDEDNLVQYNADPASPNPKTIFAIRGM